MVRRRGLEPPHLAAQASETCVSTNSTTGALLDEVLRRRDRTRFAPEVCQEDPADACRRYEPK